MSEWNFWFDAMQIRAVEPASTLRFPQYDQMISAAIEGSGVAMGVLPHLEQQLRDGVLCAPFGRERMANRGDFFIVIRRDVSGRDAVRAFVSWLRSEVGRDEEQRTREGVDRELPNKETATGAAFPSRSATAGQARAARRSGRK